MKRSFLIEYLSAIPDTVAYKSVIDAISVVTHELVSATPGCFRGYSFSRAEGSFVFPFSAVSVSVTHFLFQDARSVSTGEFTIRTFGFRLRRWLNRLTERSLIISCQQTFHLALLYFSRYEVEDKSM